MPLHLHRSPGGPASRAGLECECRLGSRHLPVGPASRAGPDEVPLGSRHLLVRGTYPVLLFAKLPPVFATMQLSMKCQPGQILVPVPLAQIDVSRPQPNSTISGLGSDHKGQARC